MRNDAVPEPILGRERSRAQTVELCGDERQGFRCSLIAFYNRTLDAVRELFRERAAGPPIDGRGHAAKQRGELAAAAANARIIRARRHSRTVDETQRSPTFQVVRDIT